MNDLRLSLRDMTERFGVTARTLRYYEYIELLAPQRAGRARFYGPRDRARMTLILRGRRFGFALEEIRQWLQLYDEQGEQAQLALFVQFASEQLAKLQKQRDDMVTTIEDLSRFHSQAVRTLEQTAGQDQIASARAG